MFDISPIQIIIVLAIALLIFGPKRLPGMGRDLGRGIRDFKAGVTGEYDGPVAQKPISEAAMPESVHEQLADARPATPFGTR